MNILKSAKEVSATSCQISPKCAAVRHRAVSTSGSQRTLFERSYALARLDCGGAGDGPADV